jgi:hypothetical protein
MMVAVKLEFKKWCQVSIATKKRGSELGSLFTKFVLAYAYLGDRLPANMSSWVAPGLRESVQDM